MNDLRLHLIAAHAAWAYAWPIAAWTLSIFCLTVFGGALRRAFAPDRWGDAALLGLDFTLGWLGSCAWLIVQSFLAHVWETPLLRVFALEPAVVGTVLLSLHARRWPTRPKLWQLAVFVAATLWHVRHFVFQPYPAGDDAAVIAGLLHNTLQQGRFALSVFSDMGTLPGYPMAASVYAWALASPLHTALGIMHALPAVAVSALVFTLADLSRDTCAFTVAALCRVSVLAFEVPFLAGGLDQNTKLSLAWCFVIGVWLVHTAKRPVGAALGFFALGLPALVNFANAYLSLAVAVVCLARRPRLATGVVLACGLGALALAQEPQLLKSRMPGVCRLYANEPFCRAPDAGVVLQTPLADTAAASARDAWPEFITRPGRLLWPQWKPFPNEAALVCFLLCALLMLGRIGELPRHFVPIAWGTALVVAFAVVQTHVFFALVPPLRHMVRLYTLVCWANVWGALAAAIVIAAAASRRGRMILFIGAAVTFVQIERQHPADAATKIFPSVTAQMLARHALRVASAVSSGTMHTGTFADFGFEIWAVPDRISQALASELGQPFRFGYNFEGAWPGAALSVSQHYRRLCASDCDYIRAMHITSAVTFADISTLCGQDATTALRANHCFREEPGEGASFFTVTDATPETSRLPARGL